MFNINRLVGIIWTISVENNLCQIISKTDQCFCTSRFFKFSLYTHIRKTSTGSHVFFNQIRIISSISEEGHPRNICAKLFFKSGQYFWTSRFSKFSLYIHIRKTCSAHSSQVFQQMRFILTNIVEGQQRKSWSHIISKSVQFFCTRRFLNWSE